MLTIMPYAAMCQPTPPKIKDTILKPLILQPKQVKEIYKGLKQGEIYKKAFSDCLISVNELDSIVQSLNVELKAYVDKQSKHDKELAELNAQLTKKTAEIAELKAKRKWYKSPILWAGLGFATGVYLMK